MRASDPVSCSKAHIYCRECAISDLIAQKAGIEAQKRQLELWEEEDTRRKEEARAAARERVVLEFERGMGLASGGGRAAVGEKVERRGGKFQLDPEAIEKASLEAEEKASAAIAAEESEARKKKIAAFWIPQNAPEAPLGPLKGVKLQTLCHVGQVHPISLKGLLPVVFTYVGKGGPGCPSCQKELNNASGAVLITSRARVEEKGEPVKKKKKKSENGVAVCGHVVCVGCAESVVKPGMRCCVCEAQVDELLPLGKEGELESGGLADD